VIGFSVLSNILKIVGVCGSVSISLTLCDKKKNRFDGAIEAGFKLVSYLETIG